MVYAVVTQPNSTNQGLVTSKARLAKQGLTIPRKELVSGHMAVNLISNVRNALAGFPVVSLTCWLDSSVALHWIREEGEYRQFVGNRVDKIRQHTDVTWRYVPSKENPADIASRGSLVNEKKELWLNGPSWFSQPNLWPTNIVTSANETTTAEAKATKELFAAAVSVRDDFDDLLAKLSYWRTLRVCAWIARFILNSSNPKSKRIRGPLSTEEIETQKEFWVIREQSRVTETFERDRLQLNLQKNQRGVLECRGRVEGSYPI